MKLIAHLIRNNGIRKEQTLGEHCRKTAEYAVHSIGSSQSMQNIPHKLPMVDMESQYKTIAFFHIVYLSAILHDMGKGKRDFFQYIEKAFQGEKVIKGSVNHTFAAVQWLLETFHTETSTVWEKLTSEIIAFAVGSHHGMFDCVDLDGKNGFLYRLRKDKKDLCYEETLQNYFEQVLEEETAIDHFRKASEEVKSFYNRMAEEYGSNKSAVCFQLGMLARLVLSAVIYGDRRDTSEFMNQKKMETDYTVTWKDRRIYFEGKLKCLPSFSKINQVRNEISEQCAAAAISAPGIYQMNVPTGAGKTLAAFRYALIHAEEYSKKRIIFIIPLLSVLDQNVKVIRDYMLDPDAVLEHHSNVVHEKDMEDELDEWELLTESWNTPVVVSTLVQFLNILFSHQTSAVGRMQALCDSVIVIDEVQTLPKRITLMFNMALNFLQRYCNTTVILSSATQPCFEELKWPLHLAKEPELVHLDRQQLEVFRRSKIVIDRKHPYGMDWDECTDFCSGLMEKHVSLLVICNTKTEAQILFERMKEQAERQGWDVYHLSTAMCQEHRMEVLEKIQNKLIVLQEEIRENSDTRKVICIATQMIESGVDFSFDGVVRVMAGIDNLIQAAGRCNRSNEYGYLGTVYLISLKNENLRMLHEIKNAQLSTRKVMSCWEQEDDDFIVDGENIHKFYQYFYQETEREIEYPVEISGERFYLAKLLANQNTYGNTKKNRAYFFRQPFKTIGQNFKVFDEDTMDVLVPYKKGADLIKKLICLPASGFHGAKIKELIHQAKPYSISIYNWQKLQLQKAGLLTPILEERACILDEKAYDDNLGLLLMGEQPTADRGRDR